nr:hypothetical protein [Treponemataceae bacterium]
MKKRFFVIFAALFFSIFSFSLYAQDASEEDPFADMFEDVEDVVVQEAESAPVPENAQKAVSFSGYLDTELGAGFKTEDGDPISPSAYFAFENYFYMTARASDVFSLKASLYTCLPDFDLSLHEIYINYLLCDLFYIQAGKRSITWGNLQLIENNILADSPDTVSVSVSVPVWKFNFAGIILYSPDWGGVLYPNWDNISAAASFEGAFGPFQFNIFGRKWANLDSNAQLPALGLETKLSIKGYDLYNQLVFNSHLDLNVSESYLDKITCTTGFMKDWEDPRIGFIVEYRYIYYDKVINPTATDNHYLYLKAGISRLFNNTSKFALEFMHDFP